MAKTKNKNKVRVNENPHIEAILGAAVLEIDLSWGLARMNKYLAEMAVLQSGVMTLADMGYSKEREEAKTLLVPMQSLLSRERHGDMTYDGAAEKHIAIITLSGVMKSRDGFSSRGAESIADEMYRAYADESIAGLVIKANSGGGDPLAGQIIYNAVKDRNKPVTGALLLAGSACYKALCGADYLMGMGLSSVTGSIGSMYTVDKEELKDYRKYVKEVYSNKATKKNFEFRELLKGNFKPLEVKATKSHEAFIECVSSNRPQVNEETFSGDTYLGEAAVAMGLVDSLGTLQDCINMTAELAGYDRASYPGLNSSFKTISNESISKSKNNTNMTPFKEAYQQMVRQWNRVFGTEANEAATTEAEHAANSTIFEAQATMAEAIASAVAKATSGMQTQIDSLTQAAALSTGKITDLEAEVTTLQAELAKAPKADAVSKLTAANAKITAWVLENSEPGTKVTDEGELVVPKTANPQHSEESFFATLAGKPVANESMY